jgi:hypothetical protein
MKTDQPAVRHSVKCKLFPDPFDERDPVGPCTCGAADQQPAVQPSATTENPEAMYNPVARESHAGASARQIDVAAGFELSDGDMCYCGGMAHKRTARCPPRAADQQSAVDPAREALAKRLVGEVLAELRADQQSDGG